MGKSDKMLQTITFLIFAEQSCFMNMDVLQWYKGSCNSASAARQLEILECFPGKSKVITHYEGKKVVE